MKTKKIAILHRIPEDLLERVDNLAKKEERSRNSMITVLLKIGLKQAGDDTFLIG